MTVVVKTIGFGWLFWKLGNILYVLDVIAKASWQRKLIAAGVMTLCMCALDFVMTAMAIASYEDWMFVLAVAGVTVILAEAMMAKVEPWHVLLRDSLFPYMTYVAIIALYWLGMPLLYNLLSTVLTGYTGKLTFFYIFPIIDSILVALLIGLNYATSINAH